MSGGAAAAGGLNAAWRLWSTVTHDHASSHDSNREAEWAATMGDASNYTLATKTQLWVPPHVNSVDTVFDGHKRTIGIGHHPTPDVNLFPSYMYESLCRAREAYPERYNHFPDLSDTELHPNFDPYASFTKEEIRRIGSFAIAIMDGLLGDEHQLKTDFTAAEALDIVDTSKPKYWYKTLQRPPKDRPLTSLEIAERLLSDPYSPSLYPLDAKVRNGIRGIGIHDVAAFRRHADVYAAREDLIAEWIRQIPNRMPDNNWGPAIMFGGVIAVSSALGLKKNGLSADVLAYIAAGSAAAGVGMLGPIGGGAATNMWGHMGETTVQEMINAFLKNQPYQIRPNPDGSVTTTVSAKNRREALFLRTVDLVSAGEIKGQGAHHM